MKKIIGFGVVAALIGILAAGDADASETDTTTPQTSSNVIVMPAEHISAPRPHGWACTQMRDNLVGGRNAVCKQI